MWDELVIMKKNSDDIEKTLGKVNKARWIIKISTICFGLHFKLKLQTICLIQNLKKITFE